MINESELCNVNKSNSEEKFKKKIKSICRKKKKNFICDNFIKNIFLFIIN